MTYVVKSSRDFSAETLVRNDAKWYPLVFNHHNECGADFNSLCI